MEGVIGSKLLLDWQMASESELRIDKKINIAVHSFTIRQHIAFPIWHIIFFMYFLAIISFSLACPALCQPSQGQSNLVQTTTTGGPLSVPAQFSGDWYSVDGGPDLQANLARSSVYQDESTSLFLTLMNTGKVTSFKAVNEPSMTQPDEVFAAQKELQLEALRSTAQDVSVQLVSQNTTAMNLKREVAYGGSLREGQVSSPLEFPIEIYENTEPGNYTLYAIINYTYQQDVAVKPNSDNPQNPDVFYWYNIASKTIPLNLRVEKKSLVDLKAQSTSPEALSVGSKNNVVNVVIQNVGNDTGKDIIARLRPETGIYVDMDESPIPSLGPGEKAVLVYKVDVSKDAIADKTYRLTLLFDFSDSYRKNLVDSDHIYITIQPGLSALLFQYWWVVLIAAAIVVLAALLLIKRKRSAAGSH
jgi:hypothetical protein